MSNVQLVTVGEPFQINTYFRGEQIQPTIATLSSGAFATVWQSQGQDGDGYGIYGLLLNSDASRRGAEFRINSHTDGNQTNAAVAQLDGGGFVTLWNSGDADGDHVGTYGQIFDAAGVAIGDEFQVSVSTGAFSVSALTEGGFVVSGTNSAQRFDESGNMVGEPSTVERVDYWITNSVVQGLENGGFIVASGGSYLFSESVFLQVFDENGAAVDETQIVASAGSSGGDIGLPKISPAESGRVLVSFDYRADYCCSIPQTTYTRGVFFDESGEKFEDIRLGPYDVILQTLAAEARTQTVLVSTVIGADGDPQSSSGVFGQRFVINTLPQGEIFVSGRYAQGSDLIAETDGITDADGIGDFTFQWLRNGTEIVGETDRIYTLTIDDANDIVNVRVSYEDGHGVVESLFSEPPSIIVGGVFEGTPGNDILRGYRGNDTVSGGTGNDKIEGHEGDDRILGGDGSDYLGGGTGNDTIIGGDTENDRRDEIFGGDGNDVINAGYGNDAVFGMDGNDSILGGFGADFLAGQNGNDTLTGSALGDTLFGNDGDDFINGGYGSDRMNGGTGADVFYHLGSRGHGSDWVQDYFYGDGDILLFGREDAQMSDFQVNYANTVNAAGVSAGNADVEEAFIIHRPSGQIIWALVDGAGQSSINMQITDIGDVFDLLV